MPTINILIDAVKEQTVVAKEQSVISNEQLKVMEDLRDVMMDVKKALRRQSKFWKGPTRRQLKASVRKAVNEVARGIRGSDRATSPVLSTTSHAPLTTTAHPRISTVPEPGEATVDRSGALSDNNKRSDSVPSESQNVSDVVLGEPDRIRAAAPPNPMNEVIELLKSVKDVLSQHGSKFDILIKDAIKALFEMAMTKTKEEVDEWIKRMDVSLVFIALFSAVLTAFLVPATQNLFPNSYNAGNPTSMPVPAPKISAQNVCLLNYLALILAIIDAILSVLGRQWMSKLTTRPEGSTYRERLMRHLAREALAKRWLKILVEGSIGLFMTGLLYQLRNLGGSFDETVPNLLVTWKVGLSLSSVIFAVVAAATIHALIYEASPFGGPFSKLLLGFPHGIPTVFKWLKQRVSLAYQASSLMVHVAAQVIVASLKWLMTRCGSKKDEEDEEDETRRSGGSGLKLTTKKSCEAPTWILSQKQAIQNYWNVRWDPFPTDTSVRVRETLRARITPFVEYCVDYGQEISEDIMRSIISPYPIPTRLQAEVYQASFADNNADLRPLAKLPFEECIARVLCSYNHKGNLGDRKEIFDLAEKHCSELLWEGKEDDVTRILSHVDRLDLIKSYIQSQSGVYDVFLRFMVEDRKHEILREMSGFVKAGTYSRLGRYPLCYAFVGLASPPPRDIDLSPVIDYLSRHPHYWVWEKISNTILVYLNSFGVSQISNSAAVRRLLGLCLDPEARDAEGDDLWRWINNGEKMRICSEEIETIV
ncbi:hypothetical protein SISNIDRAFT_504141 [Sistotremastrum niveocremeum HHB9708]|uniref:DUF6535 domain-containing protein n=1 Tax=Sistotremastrum niveocremeum HHB9708 TaxID=1314777 RepID=A0A164M709_9AGAM|nr:hypothetical protein SISNIDRAFT_504141 [Sistotremastrum niveocremeum HHB9708]